MTRTQSARVANSAMNGCLVVNLKIEVIKLTSAVRTNMITISTPSSSSRNRLLVFGKVLDPVLRPLVDYCSIARGIASPVPIPDQEASRSVE